MSLSQERAHSIESASDSDRLLIDGMLNRLPEWFAGVANRATLVETVASLPTFVALSQEGERLGFVSLKSHNDYAGEIFCMAVEPRLHGKGLGGQLVTFAAEWFREQGREYLFVKTLTDSKRNDFYYRTQAFYLRCGFRPLEEISGLWGNNKGLLMIKKLS